MSSGPKTGLASIPRPLLLAAVLGAVAALAGGYWDDAWHTERGRDRFLIAPHVAIYLGVALAGGALALHVGRVAREEGLRGAWRDRPVLLAGVSVAAILVSAPIDNAWHVAFGRDAVIWSPPHMLGIVGTLTLGAALLFAADRPAMGALVGGLVLAAAAFPVAEYDTDVPQFRALWYLPALALGAAVGFAFIRLASPWRWACTLAALTHLLLMGGLSWVLIADGFDPPALPLLIFPALTIDVSTQHGWRSSARAFAVAVALYAAYVPARNWLGNGLELDLQDVLLGLPMATAAVLVVERLAMAGPLRGPRHAGRVALVTIASLLLVVPAAIAHDPGQGADRGAMRLVVDAVGKHIMLEGRLGTGTCSVASNGRIVARRAGVTRTATLRTSGCRFRGAIDAVERGRWFVYAQFTTPRGPIESWLPVKVDGGREHVADAHRYAYEPPDGSSGAPKEVAGVVIYGAMLALLATAFALLRDRRTPST